MPAPKVTRDFSATLEPQNAPRPAAPRSDVFNEGAAETPIQNSGSALLRAGKTTLGPRGR